MNNSLSTVPTPSNDAARLCTNCQGLGHDIEPFFVRVSKHRILVSEVYESATHCRTCAVLLAAMQAAVDANASHTNRNDWMEIMFKQPTLPQGPLRIDIIGQVTTRLQLYIPTGEFSY